MSVGPERAQRLLRPSRTAHAHEGDHEPGHTTPAVSRPSRMVPHHSVRRPLVPLTGSASPPDAVTVGRKAFSLWWLTRQGLHVPPAVAIPAEIAAGLLVDEAVSRETLQAALMRWLDPAARYAVRSSADLEDGAEHSFAGQFSTRLDVPPGDVLSAVREVAEPHSERLRAYLDRSGQQEMPRIGVVVQLMVDARAAGVAFSRNPLSGLREVVVEAVPGPGHRLVDDGVTPDRWVHRWGEFTVKPDGPRVAEQPIREAVAGAERLEAALERPVDVEWAWDGHRLWWLQSRPMTGLEGLRLYSNRIAREVLPGVIKPLVWSVNVPVVNAAWVELLEELVGPLDIAPEDLARSFGYRAYFDMTTLGDVFEAVGMPRDALELLLGLPKGPEAPTFRPGPGVARHLHRMPGFLRRSLRRGRWARSEIRELRAAFAEVAAHQPSGLDEPALLDRVDTLAHLTQRAAYANIVVPLMMLVYGRGLQRQVAAAGVDPAAVDPARGRADREALDPAVALDGLHRAAMALPPATRDRSLADPLLEPGDDAGLAAFRAELDAFLERFGHLSDSGNDFSVPPWREDPARVMRMVLERGEASGSSASMATLADVEARSRPWRRPYLRLLWRRAGAFRVYREAISSVYTHGYGLFRDTFLELGRRFVASGLLPDPEDVFYLQLDELRAWVGGAAPPVSEAQGLVARRRAEVAAAAELLVPELVYGDAFVPRRADEVVRSELSGLPTSRGSVRGTARIVRGQDDFERVERGAVVVIPFSDVGWTPLFARAGGVVAEAGGMLSHASIVAREYGIPCVVSVEHATAAIPDGATVLVDGVTGSVLVEDAPGSTPGGVPRE